MVGSVCRRNADDNARNGENARDPYAENPNSRWVSSNGVPNPGQGKEQGYTQTKPEGQDCCLSHSGSLSPPRLALNPGQGSNWTSAPAWHCYSLT